MSNLNLYVTKEEDGHLDLFRRTKAYSRHPESVSFHNPLDIDCMVWFEESKTFGVKAIGLAAKSDYSLKLKNPKSKTPYHVSELRKLRKPREQKAKAPSAAMTSTEGVASAEAFSVPPTPTVPPGQDPPAGT